MKQFNQNALAREQGRKSIFKIILVTILLLSCIWGLYGIRGPERWDSLDETHMDFPSGKVLTSDERDYGVISSGPYMTLPAGQYTLSWIIESDADARLSFNTENQVEIFPGEIVLPADEKHGSAMIKVLEETCMFQIFVHFDAGTRISVEQLSLSGPRTSDREFVLSFGIILLAVLLIMYQMGHFHSPEEIARLVLLGIAVLLASLPALRMSVSLGHDGSAHIERLRSLVAGLMQGQFPVRVSGTMFHGYGNLYAVFYPALTLYPAAFMMLLHASTQLAFQVTILLLTLTSALAMNACAKRIFDNDYAGIIAAVLYLFAPYRLTDAFTRVAFGELAAMAFLPLYVREFYECLHGDRKRWPRLALCMALLFNTHLLTTLMVGFITVFYIPLLIRRRRFISFVEAGLFALCLSLGTIMPMITFFRQGIDTSNMVTLVAENTISLKTLFGFGEDSNLWTPISLSIGPMLIISACVLIPVCGKHLGKQENSCMAVRFCILGVVFCIMTLDVFPWEQLSRWTNGRTDVIQFSFRLLSFSDLLFSLSGGYAVAVLIDKYTGKAKKGIVIRLGIGIAGVLLSTLFVLPIFSQALSSRRQYVKGYNDEPMFVPPDYILVGADTELTEDRSVQTDGDVEIPSYLKFGTNITAEILAHEGSTVSFPLFAFEGYRVAIGSQFLGVQAGENNRLAVLLPAGAEGQLSIHYDGKTIWKVADIVSLVAFLFSVGFIISKRRNIE